MAASDASDECAQYLTAPGFHKSFSVPATSARDALTISYSDLGRQATEHGSASPPVLLLMPGLLASRFQGLLLHIVGTKMGVRILTIDRFVIGQSTNVPVGQRISSWVEIVPQLLAHLSVSHVALASHSAGTLYLLNTLSRCRHILSPRRPYAVLFAPFVDVKHSGVTLLQAAQFLPNAALGYFDNIARSLDSYVGPAIGSSLSFLDRWFSSAEPEPTPALLRWETEYGQSRNFLDTILQASIRASMAENTAGLNDEMRVCLKKGSTWDDCDDLDDFVKKLAVREEQGTAQARLRVKLLFAEQDSLIGERGREYMQQCWERNCRTGEGQQAIDVSASIVEGTDHDSLPGKLAILEEVLRDVLGEHEAAGQTDP